MGKYKYRKCPVCQKRARFGKGTIYVQLPIKGEQIIPMTVGVPDVQATVCKHCGYVAIPENERQRMKAMVDEVIKAQDDNGDLPENANIANLNTSNTDNTSNNEGINSVLPPTD